MTRFERILDTVHNFSVALARMTKPRWHLDRDKLLGIFGIGTALVAGISTALPEVKGLAWVAKLLLALQRTGEEVNRRLPGDAEPAPAVAEAAPIPGLRAVPSEAKPPAA
jgi:hypothetical protein